MSDKPLSEMSHAELYLARMREGADQDLLAPFEHKAFAREYVQDHPIRGTLALPFAIPGYTVAKALGLRGARSEASLDEVFAGYEGWGQGLKALLTSIFVDEAEDEPRGFD